VSPSLTKTVLNATAPHVENVNSREKQGNALWARVAVPIIVEMTVI
jgi:hypothetical protein